MTTETNHSTIFPESIIAKMTEAARAPRTDGASPSWDFRGGNFDAAESAFVARQLEHMRPGLFEIQYPSLKGLGLVPANTSVPSGAEQHTITIIDQYGKVNVMKTMGGPIGRVELSTTQKSIGFFSMALAYGYTVQEARAAMMAGMPLIPTKAMATRDQMERKLDEIIFVGETTVGAKGLLNQTGTETYTTPTGSGGSKTFALKTANEVLFDLNAMVSQVIVNSLEIEVPDTMLMPTSVFENISTRKVGDGSDSTIMKYFRANNDHIKRVETSFRCESNTGWTGKRMMAYRNDPIKLELFIPQRFEQFAPQAQNLEVVTICHMRCGGIGLYAPKSVIYADEV